MSISTEIPPLTAEQIKVIRSAKPDSISYHDVDGAGVIRLHEESQRRGDWRRDEWEYEIPCRSYVRDYSDENLYGRLENGNHRCFAMDHCPRTHGVWPLLVAFLRAGDEVYLEWSASGNGYTRDHDLHHDELWLVIRRERKRAKFGPRHDEYRVMIDCSVCPDNTARMIRRRRDPQ